MEWKIRIRFGEVESSLGYLEHMAAKGWLLESWKGIMAVFRRCEPRKLRFAMDIVPGNGWQVDDKLSSQSFREDYIRFYEEMGWHYVDNQEGKFIFCTEDMDIPLPHTDPMSYRATIFKSHKKQMIVFVAMMILLIATFAKIGKDSLYYILVSVHDFLRGIGLLMGGIGGLIMGIQNIVQVRRESRLLKQGIVPEIRGSERWFQIGMAFVFGMVIIIILADIIGSGFQSKTGWLAMGAMTILFGAMDLLPVFLHRVCKRPKEEALQSARGFCRLWMIISSVLAGFCANGFNQLQVRLQPQDVTPFVTLTELGKEEDRDPYYLYNGCLTEQYTYYMNTTEDSLRYHLYLSDWDVVLDSFENSYSGSGFFREWGEWRDDVMYLDHEQFGLNSAWFYDSGDYAYRYRYYLRTEGAAVLVETSVELSQEWIQELSARLNALK